MRTYFEEHVELAAKISPMLLNLANQTLVNMRPSCAFACYHHGSSKCRIGSCVHIPIDGATIRSDHLAIVDQDLKPRHRCSVRGNTEVAIKQVRITITNSQYTL